MVVNIFGEPSAGKSTSAAYIFSKLKLLGYKCELVTEFAKEKVYESNNIGLANQIFVFANQFYRMDNVANQTDIVITDSPLPTAALYGKNEYFSKDMERVIMDCFNMYDNLNYMLIRNHSFKGDGRIHNEEESKLIRSELKDLLNRYDIKYEELVGGIDNCEKIISDIINRKRNGE